MEPFWNKHQLWLRVTKHSTKTKPNPCSLYKRSELDTDHLKKVSSSQLSYLFFVVLFEGMLGYVLVWAAPHFFKKSYVIAKQILWTAELQSAGFSLQMISCKNGIHYLFSMFQKHLLVVLNLTHQITCSAILCISCCLNSFVFYFKSANFHTSNTNFLN